MSQTKHRFYRTVLLVENFNINYNGALIPCKRVVWCVKESATSRSIKTKHTCVVTSGGIFDTEKWSHLDHSRLAFRKDENGNFINGLFE